MRNRTFFFTDYQGTRIRQALTAQASLAPLAWRTGNFSGFHPVLDPNTTVIQGDQILRQFGGIGRHVANVASAGDLARRPVDTRAQILH